MLSPKYQMLHGTLKRLMRRQAAGPLDKVIAKTHAADLAFLLPHLSVHERQLLLERCPDSERRAEVLAEADSDVAAQTLMLLPRGQDVDVLHRMEPDDISDILEHLPQEMADDLLERMQAAERSEVEELARYGSATAGGIMSPRFFALHRETSARDAIEALHQADTDVEMAFYVYVIDEEGQLLGVVSLRQLVTSKPERRLSEIMTSDVIRVGPEEDQEEVAKLASRYGLLAIPVVDGGNKLLGIVTIDDVIDVLQEEATEDILRMAGAGDELMGQKKVLSSAVKRLPWLMATGVGGVVGGLLLAIYGPTLWACRPLVFFIPALLGLAGVVGLQSSAVVSQGIAQGRLDLARLGSTLLRQIGTGMLLGIASGVLIGGFGWIWFTQAPVACSRSAMTAALGLGLGVAAAMTAASALGVLLPSLLAKIRVDPALASSPFVAIGADLLGLLVYLTIARAYF